MMIKVIVLTGILLLYFKFILHNSDEIEPNIYFIRICRNEGHWSNLNDTFWVNKTSSHEILINLSDPKVKYKAINESPYSRDKKTTFYEIPVHDVTLDEAMNETILAIFYVIHIKTLFFRMDVLLKARLIMTTVCLV